MAAEESIRSKFDALRESILMADATAKAFYEALGEAETPMWAWVYRRQTEVITEAFDALETLYTLSIVEGHVLGERPL